jgi:precorrin-6Y C5,15-methyltransferase (decarboxylating)
VTGPAASWDAADVAALNTIAVTCIADPGVTGLSRCAGLPDAAYTTTDNSRNARFVP